MTLKDRIKALCKAIGISTNKVENDLGFGTGYISKLGKSAPNSKKLQSIADYFGVTIEFLIGNTDKICCPECEFNYNPLDKESLDLHEKIHADYRNAIFKYGFCYSSDKYRDEICSYVNVLSNPTPDNSTEDIYNTYIKYLKIEFSELLRNSNYNLKYDSFDDYVREHVLKDIHENFMSHDLFNKLSKNYNLEHEYISADEKLLARASNNQQLMRILAYAERLAPETLDSIEVQIKALADNSNRE